VGNIILAQTSCDASPNKDTILIFNSEGDLINSWGEQFYGNAHGLTLHEEDGVEYLYVVDDKNGVYKCSMEGEVLFHWGKPEIYEENEWKWGPANVLVMNNGDIYLVEGYGEAYVLHFNAQGDLLNRFGGRIEGPEGTNWAHGIHLAEFEGEQLLHITCDDPSEVKRFTLDGKYHSTFPVTLQHPRGIYGTEELWAIPEMQCRLTLYNPKTEKSVHLGDWGKTMQEIFELRSGSLESMPIGSFCSAHGATILSDGRIVISEWIEVGRLSVLTPVE